jgi:hydrogenase nickel incorporation protein HypA/HybF
MHELSIAVSIVEIATDEARKANVESFSEIILDIGTLSGVEIDALDFAMKSAIQDSVLDNAKVIINRIQARARCKQCQHEFDVDTVFTVCQKCSHFDLDVFQGKEMKVRSLVVT